MMFSQKCMTLKKFALFICNLLKKSLEKFEKIRTNSIKFEKLIDWKFEIRFDGKIIRFVRFEKFSIWLIRKYIFNSKNSRKMNSKFVLFDSTPPLVDFLNQFLDHSVWLAMQWLKSRHSEKKFNLNQIYDLQILYIKQQISVCCDHFSQKPHHQFWWNLV